jgi:hypothetical protein
MHGGTKVLIPNSFSLLLLFPALHTGAFITMTTTTAHAQKKGPRGVQQPARWATMTKVK